MMLSEKDMDGLERIVAHPERGRTEMPTFRCYACGNWKSFLNKLSVAYPSKNSDVKVLICTDCEPKPRRP
jgi:hypothetical protein